MANTELNQLLDQVKDTSPKGRELVKDAYDFTKEAHKDHKRYSGEPYFVHPYSTAKKLAEMGLSPKVIAAGLLHDTIEDVGITEKEIEEKFGKEVLFLIQGVTKLGAFKYHGLVKHAESLRKLFIATSSDIRVLLIKLMDRLHNMETLQHVPTHKRKRIALETLDIYAPIADRLGMNRVKRQLEDLAFPYVSPEEYEETKQLLKEKSKENLVHLEKVQKSLKKELAEQGMTNFTTEYRIKGIYSLYNKLQRKGKEIDKIHDISALRIIVPSVDDCYRVLGIIHHNWRPLPGKIKDYIAFPKPNGYQSLHTTIFTGDGGILEIQIRTPEMHREAMYGIASHLSYKENTEKNKRTGGGTSWIKNLTPFSSNKTKSDSEYDDSEKIDKTTAPPWIRELVEEQENAQTSEAFLNQLKTDFFSHRVFVFTPKGDVVDLPIDSSPIDFAYAIHSDIGHHTAAAKVNGKMASLDTKLKSGDIVKIETSDSSAPKRKWLDYTKTSLAQRRIKSYLQKQNKSKQHRSS